MIGTNLKCSIDDSQFLDRLKYNPSLIEFHLFEGDLFGKRRELLEERIKYCITHGIKVYIHHPIMYNRQPQDILTDEHDRKLYFDLSSVILFEICEKYDIFTIVHPHYLSPIREVTIENSKRLCKEMKPYQEKYGYRILWENSSRGIFSTENPHLLDEIVKPLKLSMCYDISHAFIGLNGDNVKMEQSLKELLPYINYYHICDSMGIVHDSLPIAKGRIDWVRFTPYFQHEDFVLEVELEDLNNAESNLKSVEYLQRIVSANTFKK